TMPKRDNNLERKPLFISLPPNGQHHFFVCKKRMRNPHARCSIQLKDTIIIFCIVRRRQSMSQG
ncbi:MAG TPA: hypothetical protein VM553_18475, partial [Dongiaceae bacterium]|nr:hypothetical protein [Dongiaceae bacterium]